MLRDIPKEKPARTIGHASSAIENRRGQRPRETWRGVAEDRRVKY